MPFAHDHVIFLVSDPDRLEAVCASFAEAGFLITDRDDANRATAKTQQRLICFHDGSYIEFLALTDPGLRAAHRYAGLLACGDGWVDYVLVTEDLDDVQRKCKQAGLPFDGPKTHTRTLADGRPWGVSLVLTGIGVGHPALPMILQDTKGRDLRIPQSRLDHPNGALGILGATLAMRDPDGAATALSQLLGPTEAIDQTTLGTPGHRAAVTGAWVEIAGAGAPDSLGARRLETWGEGMTALTLRTAGADNHRAITPAGPWSLIHLVADAADSNSN